MALLKKMSGFGKYAHNEKIIKSQVQARNILAASPKAQMNPQVQTELKQRLLNKKQSMMDNKKLREWSPNKTSRFSNSRKASQKEVGQYADSVVERQYTGYQNRVKELGLADKGKPFKDISSSKPYSYNASSPAFAPKSNRNVISVDRGNPQNIPGIGNKIDIRTGSDRMPGSARLEKLAKQTNKQFSSNALHAGDPLNKVKPRKKVAFSQPPTKLMDATQESALKSLNRMDKAGTNNLFSRTKEMTGALTSSAIDYYKGEGRLKKAGIGVLQASAVSAAGHAGVAALSGDDPWEAAKTGAVRGAMVGSGYQFLKGATRADTGTLWGNMGHIKNTTRDLSKATTVAGRQEFREKGMSKSLATLLSAREGAITNRSQTTGKVGNHSKYMMNGYSSN